MEKIENLNDIKDKVFKHLFVQIPGKPASWLKEPGHMRILVKGEGIRVTDIKGNTYIDGAAGWQYGLIGHGRKEVADAIRNQAIELAICAPEFINIPVVKLATKLAEITPGGFTKVSFCNSGSESVEIAMKMAKQYHVLNGEPRRHKVISRRGSYHGNTWGAMSIQGCMRHLLSYFDPMVPMAIRVPQPYCYRCDYGLSYPGCNIECAREIERVIVNESPENISSVIGEPVSFSSLVAIPPPEYWPTVRSICNKYGVLLINDCVLTGFGRTGKWFACEHWAYLPDIINFAKGLTSGYIPMGGVITTSEIANVVESGPDMGLISLSTWGGNPNSAAGALANIAVIEQENLVENSAKMGKYMLDGFKDRLMGHPIIGDIRGIGLMIGIEMVADKKTKIFFDSKLDVPERMLKKLEENRFLCRQFATTLLLSPPLCITKNDVEEIIDILDKIIISLAKDLGY